MPPRRNPAAAVPAAPAAAQAAPAAAAAQPRRTRILTLMTLTKTNFDAWEQAVDNVFYAEGWSALFDASNVPQNAAGNAPGARVDDANLPDRSRQLAWGTITSSLEASMLMTVSRVRRGEVEALLRELRALTYRNSAATRSSLKSQLLSAQLDSHADLEAYITHIENLTSRLASLGHIVDAEDKQFYLLRGLPDDYEIVKQTVRVQQNPAWERILDLLRDFVACHPRVLGSTASGNGNGHERRRGHLALTSEHEQQEVCRDFSKGACKRGNRCRFKHVTAPRKCQYCQRNGHVEQNCFKKQRDLAATHHSHNSTAEQKQLDLPASPRHQGDETWDGIPDRRFDFQFCAVEEFSISDRCYGARTNSTSWLLDGGATCHITWDESSCFDVRPSRSVITVGGNHELSSTKVGKLQLQYVADGVSVSLIISNVRIVPDFGRNILSELPFLAKGCCIVKDRGVATILSDHGRGKCVASIKQDTESKLFVLWPSTSVQPQRCLAATKLPSTGTRPVPLERAPESGQSSSSLTAILHSNRADSTHVQISGANSACAKQELNANTALMVLKPLSQKPPVAGVEHPTSCYPGQCSTTRLPSPCNKCTESTDTTKCETKSNAAISTAVETGTSNQASACNKIVKNSRCSHVFVSTDGGMDSIVALQLESPGSIPADHHLFKPAPESRDPSSSHADLQASKGQSENSCNAARQYATADLSELQLWHNRLGHRYMRDVARLLGVSAPVKPIFCRSCVEGKSHRHPMRPDNREPRSSPRPGYMLHSDMAGPFRVPTRNGERWLNLLVDDHSDRLFLLLLTHKSEFFPMFKEFVAQLEAKFGRSHVIAQLLTDGAGSYTSNALDAFCTSKGIYQVFSAPYTPNMNPVAERNIRTLVEMTRTMMIHAGAPKSLSGEALRYACYIINRCPKYYDDGAYETRMERWNQRPQPRAHKSIRVWGCAAWVLDLNDKGKFDPKSTMHMLLGIDPQYRCYLLGKLPHFELVRSPHVTFNETLFPCRQRFAQQHRLSEDFLSQPSSHDGDAFTGPPMLADSLPVRQPRTRRDWTPSAQCLRNIANADSHPAAVAPATVAAACLSHSVEQVFASTSEVSLPDPKDYGHAMSLPDAVQWRIAEIEEFLAHKHNKTFGDATHLPPGHKAIPAAYVHKYKRNKDRKVRVVIRGYHMMPGVDFNETFAPVARISSIRILLALAAKGDYELLQLDVKTAFLSADMDTEVYVTLPPAFNESMDLKQPNVNSRTVHRLLKGVPGIPQGSHLFNKKFDKVITSMQFCRVADDYCLYKVKNEEIFLIVWVDDILLVYAQNQQPQVDDILASLKTHFQIHVLGSGIEDLLGVRVTRDRANRLLTLDQSKAVETLLNKAGMADCNICKTPLPMNAKFTKADCPQSEYEKEDMREEAKWFRSNLASCIYLQMWTRPDIAFSISKLSKFMHNPGPKHVVYLKHLLRYLKGSKLRGLTYDFSNGSPRAGVYGYYDAAHTDDRDTRRSTMAHLFFYEGCCISWKSKLHTYVTTSTNHSEYVASAKAAKEAKWLSKIFAELGKSKDVSPIALFSDSKGAIALNYNPVNYEANKHVDLADHYAREQVQRGIITITYIQTGDMLADALTKILPCKQFLKLINSFTSIVE